VDKARCIIREDGEAVIAEANEPEYNKLAVFTVVSTSSHTLVHACAVVPQYMLVLLCHVV
jgi:hypothetical protein